MRSVGAPGCLVCAALRAQEKKAAEEKMVVEGPKADDVPAGISLRQPAITSIHPSDGRPGATVATIYDRVGIDYNKEYLSPIGRPVRIANGGQMIKKLFA